MLETKGERENLNSEAEGVLSDEELKKRREKDITDLYNQRIVEFKTVVEAIFPSAEKFGEALSSAKKKMGNKEGGDHAGDLSDLEKMAVALEENRNMVEEQRTQVLNDLQKV